MKMFYKNKYFFKLRNLLELFRSDSYCLLTLKKKSDKEYYLDSARINLFTESQHDVLLSAGQLFANENLNTEHKISEVVNEAKKLINSNQTT